MPVERVLEIEVGANSGAGGCAIDVVVGSSVGMRVAG
jgi:hypothetical protein